MRRKLEKVWRKEKTDANREAYINQRRVCCELSTKKKEEYYSKILENAGNDQKTLFAVANEILDRKNVRSLPEYDDPVKLANEF